MDVFEQIRTHEFHPIRDAFTFHRHLDKHGVADLDDRDWRIRTLAVRDLVRLGRDDAPAMIENDNYDFEHPERLQSPAPE